MGLTWFLNTGFVLALLGQNTKHQRYRDSVATIGSKQWRQRMKYFNQDKLASSRNILKLLMIEDYWQLPTLRITQAKL